MDLTKEQVGSVINTLLAQDKYKMLSTHLGGWFWTTEAVWAVINTFTTLGMSSLRRVVLTALSVPGQFADLLEDFVDDLFDILAIIGDEASDIAADADAFGESPLGQSLQGIFGPEQYLMGRTGMDNRTLRVLAGVLNPMPGLVNLGAATAKNTVDASNRIGRKLSGGRRGR